MAHIIGATIPGAYFGYRSGYRGRRQRPKSIMTIDLSGNRRRYNPEDPLNLSGLGQFMYLLGLKNKLSMPYFEDEKRRELQAQLNNLKVLDAAAGTALKMAAQNIPYNELPKELQNLISYQQYNRMFQEARNEITLDRANKIANSGLALFFLDKDTLNKSLPSGVAAKIEEIKREASSKGKELSDTLRKTTGVPISNTAAACAILNNIGGVNALANTLIKAYSQGGSPEEIKKRGEQLHKANLEQIKIKTEQAKSIIKDAAKRTNIYEKEVNSVVSLNNARANAALYGGNTRRGNVKDLSTILANDLAGNFGKVLSNASPNGAMQLINQRAGEISKTYGIPADKVKNFYMREIAYEKLRNMDDGVSDIGDVYNKLNDPKYLQQNWNRILGARGIDEFAPQPANSDRGIFGRLLGGFNRGVFGEQQNTAPSRIPIDAVGDKKTLEMLRPQQRVPVNQPTQPEAQNGISLLGDLMQRTQPQQGGGLIDEDTKRRFGLLDIFGGLA